MFPFSFLFLIPFLFLRLQVDIKSFKLRVEQSVLMFISSCCIHLKQFLIVVLLPYFILFQHRTRLPLLLAWTNKPCRSQIILCLFIFNFFSSFFFFFVSVLTTPWQILDKALVQLLSLFQHLEHHKHTHTRIIMFFFLSIFWYFETSRGLSIHVIVFGTKKKRSWMQSKGTPMTS